MNIFQRIINFFRPVQYSKITINDLLAFSNAGVFKKPVEERVKRVGSIKYLGWKEIVQRDGFNLKLFINLYFIVQGEKHKTKKGVYRNNYLIIIQFPYKKDIKNFKRMYNAPVKIFASDPSFIFFGDAYILHNIYNALVIDSDEAERALKYAITHAPKIRNPQMIPYLTKHSFKLIMKWLANERPARILKDEKKIKGGVRIPNEMPKSPKSSKKTSFWGALKKILF